jgi:hypothetical protein
MFLLDLQGNAIHGSLPSKWNSPRMQLIILDNNALTGRALGSALDAHAIGANKMQALQLLADLMLSILLFEAAVSCKHLLVGSWPCSTSLCRVLWLVTPGIASDSFWTGCLALCCQCWQCSPCRARLSMCRLVNDMSIKPWFYKHCSVVPTAAQLQCLLPDACMSALV